MESRITSGSLAAAIADLKAATTPAAVPAPDGRVSKQEAAAPASRVASADPTPTSPALASSPAARDPGAHSWLEIDGMVMFEPTWGEIAERLGAQSSARGALFTHYVRDGRYRYEFESAVRPDASLILDAVRSSIDLDQDRAIDDTLVRSVQSTLLIAGKVES